MSEKTKEILSDLFGYIVIVITCALYILTAIFALNPTGKSIWQIIGDGILVFCMGITMDHLFTIQGIINGMKSSLVHSTMVLYGHTIEKINGALNKLADWCNAKNKKTYKEQRTKILARAGLRYEDCFEEDGTAKPFEYKYVEETYESEIIFDKQKNVFAVAHGKHKNNEYARIKALKRKNKRKKQEEDFKEKCYWQAVKLKLSELYPNELTSEGGKKDDPNNLGRTVHDYMTVDSIKTWLAKIFFAFVLGIYGISLIENFSWIELLWRAFQICLFSVFGIIKMKKATMFITNDYRARIIKKIDNLEEFYSNTVNETVENLVKGENLNV